MMPSTPRLQAIAGHVMAKLKRGLGMGSLTPTQTGNSVPFGTKSSEPFGTVPSHSIHSDDGRGGYPAMASGRPPVMTDDQLLDLARSLNATLGRPPKSAELIEEAGGCQRRRALTAIERLRTELAQRAVRSQMLFAPAIEHQLRSLMNSWLDLAADHLTQRQAEFVLQQDERIEAAMAHVEELQGRLSDLQAATASTRSRFEEQTQQLKSLTQERDQLRVERDALRAVAAERQRVIDQLVLGPAMVTAVASEAA